MRSIYYPFLYCHKFSINKIMKKTSQLYFRTLYIKQNILKLIKTKIRFAHVFNDIVRCLKGGNNMEKQILTLSVVESKNPSCFKFE